MRRVLWADRAATAVLWAIAILVVAVLQAISLRLLQHGAEEVQA